MNRSGDETNSPNRQAKVPSRPEPSSSSPHMALGSSNVEYSTSDAVQYLNVVKDRFRDSHKYNEFIEVMKDFKAQRIQTLDLIEEIKNLFQGNRDLILGFNDFLPVGYQITLPPDEEPPPKRPVKFQDALSFVNKVEARFQDDHMYKAFLETLDKYSKDNKDITEVYQEFSTLFSEHPDLVLEVRQYFPDSVLAAVPYPTSGKNPVLQRDGNSALLGTGQIPGEKKLITSHVDRDQSVDHQDIGTDRDFDHNGQHFSEKQKSSRKIENYVGGGEHGENFVAHHGSSSYGIYDQEFAFCEKVQERFGNSHGYEDFIKFLDVYSRENLSQSDFKDQVRNLFGGHQDLIEGFIDIFPRCANIDGFLAALGKRTEKGVGFGTSNRSTQRMSLYSNKDKHAAKSIHELDLSKRERCTPNYRLLPKDYPIPLASHRTEIGNAVLNDNWVSVTSASDSFKHMRKNQFEEALFRCEDDRFELDMLIEGGRSAINRVEDLLNKITDNSVEIDSSFNITDHLTVLNLRCIKQLYEGHGVDVMDLLKKDAPGVLPVILKLLKQKQMEREEKRAENNEVWAKVYADNHKKLLDHQSNSLKQKDEKSLSTRALMEEIKELGVKKIKGDSYMLAAMMVGNRPPIIPELNTVRNLWASFLEPMLGAPRQARYADDAGDVLESNNHISESNPNRKEDGPAEIVNHENGDETSQIGV